MAGRPCSAAGSPCHCLETLIVYTKARARHARAATCTHGVPATAKAHPACHHPNSDRARSAIARGLQRVRRGAPAPVRSSSGHRVWGAQRVFFKRARCCGGRGSSSPPATKPGCPACWQPACPGSRSACLQGGVCDRGRPETAQFQAWPRDDPGRCLLLPPFHPAQHKPRRGTSPGTPPHPARAGRAAPAATPAGSAPPARAAPPRPCPASVWRYAT